MLFTPELRKRIDDEYMIGPFESEKDIQDFTASFGGEEHIETLRELEINEFIEPVSFFDVNINEMNLYTFEAERALRGADELKSIVVDVTIGGKDYYLFFDAVRYGDQWYLDSLNGIIGVIMGLSSYSAGVMPQ
jgi:hypothetical protein